MIIYYYEGVNTSSYIQLRMRKRDDIQIRTRKYDYK